MNKITLQYTECILLILAGAIGLYNHLAKRWNNIYDADRYYHTTTLVFTIVLLRGLIKTSILLTRTD